MAILTKEEKAQIINSHIRSLEFNKYNLEIDIIQENAKETPSTETINSINTQKSEVSDQIAALTSELTKVNLLTE
jgi:hypothetical protein